MPNILLLSDDTLLKDDLADQIKLAEPEFEVYTNDDRNTHFDIVILDEKTCRPNIKAPVFLLSSDEENGGSENFHVFAKPFKLAEFLDALQAGINRFENSSDGYLTFNNYELHPAGKEILNLRNNELIKLTEKEVSIIKYLYKSRERIVSKNELLQEVWGYSPDASTHTIETHIYRLRQKVEHENPEDQLIITNEGGYKLKI